MIKNNIHIETCFGDMWNKYGWIYLRGDAFIYEELISGSRLVECFKNKSDDVKIQILKKLNGFFSIVEVTRWGVFAAVDRIRSIPVFYAIKNNWVFLSDDPRWIRNRIGEIQFGDAAKSELLLTRYITGPDTLSPSVKQIQAGEAVFIKQDKDDGIVLQKVRYFTYSSDNCINSSKNELLLNHDEILHRAFDRLIRWADNRPIVVPLSGGYDSRLVVLMLKRLQYRNIIAFSFGKPDNPEAIISRQVAKKLGIKWFFVSYDSQSMYRWINSNEWKEYNRMGDGMCCACFDREWPAIWELKRQNKIPHDSIFVPGHSGDFTAGGHIPMRFLENSNVTPDEFVEEVFTRHYTMWDWDGAKKELKPVLYNRIIKCIGEKKNYSMVDAVNAYEKWVWQEFETKYLINAVRVYEFWGYKWWLPLWDADYVDFWKKVPLEWKINKKLYIEYVVMLYSMAAGITMKEAIKRNDSPSFTSVILSHLKECVRKSVLKQQAKKVYHMLTPHRLNLPKVETPFNDWEQSLGRMKLGMYEKLQPYITCRSSIITLEKLGYIQYTDDDVSEDVIEFLKKLKG